LYLEFTKFIRKQKKQNLMDVMKRLTIKKK
jgi:hypothetical protein